MHHALHIPELLLDFFRRCRRRDLYALARSCRAFKEPALDALWEELYDLSPLARCLPEASYCSPSHENSVSAFHGRSPLDFVIAIAPQCYRVYSFSRPLLHNEWHILRTYTHRIRSLSVRNSLYELDSESIKSLSNQPTSEPLFPNVRSLSFDYEDSEVDPEDKSLFLFAFPSLSSLKIRLHNLNDDLRVFQDSLASFTKNTPNLRTFYMNPSCTNADQVYYRFICNWHNLEVISCSLIKPGRDSFLHFAGLHKLTRLSFTLNDTLLRQISSLSSICFPNLQYLWLVSESLASVSKLLFQTRLPSLIEFFVRIRSRPSKHDLSSIFAAIHASGFDCTIENLDLDQIYVSGRRYLSEEEDPMPMLRLEDLRQCMALRHLHHLRLNVRWKVGLADVELLTLASAWPRLGTLYINKDWGWRTPSLGVITPNGLMQVLQKCPSLTQIALALDTRGYTTFELPASIEMPPPRVSFVHVIDSSIEVESIPALSVFFSKIASPSRFALDSWYSSEPNNFRDRNLYHSRWQDVCNRVRNGLRCPSS